MSFDARHHANEPASGKPDPDPPRFLAGAAATGALGVIGVNLFVRQASTPRVANASRQKRLRSQVLPPGGQILDINGNVMARSVRRYNLTAIRRPSPPLTLQRGPHRED